MVDYKNGKWSNKIIELQKSEGHWGYFHSLAIPTSQQPITTEQALRRLRILGFTKDDAVIKKALIYMHDCLAGEMTIPDGRERQVDGEVFINLMLAVWIRKFTRDDVLANDIARKWSVVVSAAFQNGKYDPCVYDAAFHEIIKPGYGRAIRLDYFYPISLLAGEIDKTIEKAYFDYIMDSETSYYYGFTGALSQLPSDFCSKAASRYLAAIEIYCEYPNKYCKDKLKFVARWLNENKNANGKWDMGSSVKDGVYFPLSDAWRLKDLQERDCTYRIQKILESLDAT